MSTTDGLHATHNNFLSSTSATAVYRRMGPIKAKVMVLLDINQAAEVGGEESGPNLCQYEHTAILSIYKLANIASCRVINNPCQVVKRAHWCLPKLPLHKTESRIWGKLVWPVIMKWRLTVLCRPVRTLHIRYCTCTMVLFLFCPE